MNQLGGFMKKRRTGAPGRRKRLKYIAVLPSLITLMNGLFGFLAIGYASRGIVVEGMFFNRPGLTFFALAGYMVFFAMIADMLDGRVARWSNSTSSFGGQLDSLCDAISFGVAPAFLMVKVVEVRLRQVQVHNAVLAVFLGKAIFFAAAVYVCCTVVRLARFNVENEESESSHMVFTGLPSPAAAGTIVSLVIFQQDVLPKLARHTGASFRLLENLVVWSLPVVALLAGLLMVSRVRYPHLLNQHLRGKKSFSAFIWVIFGGLLVFWNIQLAMVISFCGFAIWGVLRQAWTKKQAEPSMEAPAADAPPEQPAGS